MKILIPTLLEKASIEYMLKELARTAPNCEVIASCSKASASVNRNICLDSLTNDDNIAIMLDDDIRGFYEGWVEDLLHPFDINPNIAIVSARLLKEDGTFGPTCSCCMDAIPDEIEIKGKKHCILPTAAIAFRNRGHRFDERYLGSGWEDNDWIAKYVQANPDSIFIQSNRCKLIHLNEMKEQKGENWSHNKALFYATWPNGIPYKQDRLFV